MCLFLRLQDLAQPNLFSAIRMSITPVINNMFDKLANFAAAMPTGEVQELQHVLKCICALVFPPTPQPFSCIR